MAGNIGAGKTTLTTLLARHYNWKAEYEVVDPNPYLEDFYNDMQRWAFHLQVYFLNSRFQQLSRIAENKGPSIQDRTIYEDAYIFAANLHKTGLLSDREYETYLSVFESMLPFTKAPDLLIYLRAEVPKLKRQIRNRGRAFEKSIPADYLENLNLFYEEWISRYNSGALLIIDVNELDFTGKPDDFAFITGKIDRKLQQITENNQPSAGEF